MIWKHTRSLTRLLLACARGGAGESQKQCERTRKAVANTIRRVGALRLISEKHSFGFPFRKAFLDGSLKRFFRRSGSERELKLQSLLDAVGSLTGMGHSEREEVRKLLIAEETELANVPDHQIVHGKDLVSFVSWYFEMPLEIAAGMIRLALSSEIEALRAQPRLGEAVQWVKAA